MDFSSTTARILVPRRLDRGLSDRISSGPGRGRQRAVTEMLRNLVAAGSINRPLTGLALELEAANRSDMNIYGMCSFELIVHGLSITMDTVVIDLNCQAILGMDILN